MCVMINNLPKCLVSSVFSGCLRTNQVILAIIHYSLNTSCERCSMCSSSLGSPLGSIQNLYARYTLYLLSGVQCASQDLGALRKPKSSGSSRSVHSWLCTLGPFSWARDPGMAALMSRLQPDAFKLLPSHSPISGQAHIEVPSFASWFV